MKKLLCLCTMASCLAAVNLIAQSSFTNGLVAYYRFNASANDDSGFGNNGVVNSATLTVDRLGRPSSAYAFNGASWINVPDSPSLRIAGNITVVCWVKLTATNNPGIILAKGTGNLVNYRLSPGTVVSPYWLFQQYPPSGGGGCQENTASQVPALELGKWFQMVGVRSNLTCKLYINGTLMAQRSICASTTYVGSEPLLIGNAGFFGCLDDIRIYNRALSESEIQQLYTYDDSYCSPRAATATATLVNGFVVGATVADHGCGYPDAPTVLIQGGGGYGATATATITNGHVTAIIITDAGCCYTNAPNIVIASPPFIPTLSIAVSKVKVTQHVGLGLNYVLEASPDLVTWTVASPQFTADSETITIEFDVDVTGRFFRIRQVP